MFQGGRIALEPSLGPMAISMLESSEMANQMGKAHLFSLMEINMSEISETESKMVGV
jgi:hypothetical protein